MGRLWRGVVAVALASGCTSERDFQEQTQKDNWFQARNNEIDILWVVDDSCSMEEEQATLAAGFSSFVGQMEASGTDFHIGVISTSFDYNDSARGTLVSDPDGTCEANAQDCPPYLTKNDDYVNQFIQRATGLGIGGLDKEKGLEAAAHALSPAMTFGGANDGFIRPSAQLLVVFVSDEEDCSDRGALGDQPAEDCYKQDQKLVPVTTFIEEFRELKSSQDMVQVGAIVGVQNAACNDAFPGSRYIQLAKSTGGLVEDICLNDWSDTLTELGLTATGIRTTFKTTKVAQIDTLTVKVNGEDVTSEDWTYDEETCFLTFGPDSVPPRDSDVLAEYSVAPGNCP